jgi:glycosyltransferase involved in cell wall biosynthesis
MAAGTPVIATKVGGMPEIIEDHRTGLLVQPADDLALAAAIYELYEDKKLRNRLITNAKVMCAARFNADAMLDKYEQCYQDLVAAQN